MPCFDALDAAPKAAQALPINDVAGYCGMLLQHVSSHVTSHREAVESALTQRRCQELRQDEAKAEDVLQWHLRVLRSHQWHKRSAFSPGGRN